MRKRGAQFSRRIDPTAGLHAIAMLHPLDASQKTDESLALRANLEALRTGHGAESAFHTITAAVNVSMVLCERGKGAEHLTDIIRAQDHLMRLWQRAQEKGRWLFDGGGWQHVKHAIDIHEAQLANVTRREASDALHEVIRRINQGLVFEEQRA